MRQITNSLIRRKSTARKLFHKVINKVAFIVVITQGCSNIVLVYFLESVDWEEVRKKMNKKVLMSTIALLALFIVTISPVRAIRKEPFESHVEVELIDPGKQWISEEGIIHMKGRYLVGSHEGTLGTGIEEVWGTHWNLDLATGEGTLGGKWLVTFTPEDTIAGSLPPKIQDQTVY